MLRYLQSDRVAVAYLGNNILRPKAERLWECMEANTGLLIWRKIRGIERHRYGAIWTQAIRWPAKRVHYLRFRGHFKMADFPLRNTTMGYHWALLLSYLCYSLLVVLCWGTIFGSRILMKLVSYKIRYPIQYLSQLSGIPPMLNHYTYYTLYTNLNDILIYILLTSVVL